MITTFLLDLPASGGRLYCHEKSLTEKELFHQTAQFAIAFIDKPAQEILDSARATFKTPAILRTKPCQDASGYFWTREKRLADGQLEFHVTDFRFLIKHPTGPGYGYLKDPVTFKNPYYWEKLRFSTCWSSSGTSVLLCHDIGKEMQARMRHDLIGSGGDLHRAHAFSPHSFVVSHILGRFDKAVWAWRDRVRELEIERQRQTQDLGDESNNMHEIARHLIHSSEMLETALSSMQQMRDKAATFPVYTHSSDNSTVKNDLDFYASLMTSSFNRSKALEARMQNEISLVGLPFAILIFHATARRDSAISTRIADAAKRDGETMKTLSTLGVVFLPGTFVSSLFGMNFFDYSPGDAHTKEMTVSSNFWIFWAVSVPLTISVILTWYVWQAQQSKRTVQQKAGKLPTVPRSGRQDDDVA